MAYKYEVINEAAWERAMHCAAFRNSVEPAFCKIYQYGGRSKGKWNKE